MNRDRTELVLVLDRSGSMSSCVKDTEGGAAALIQKQKEEPGQVYVTYVRFDNVVEVVYQGVNINDIGPIKVEPRGSTALYDGICTAIDKVGERLANTQESERPALVVVAIMTDGGENASLEFNAKLCKEKIQHQTEKYGWQFLFLGANQDAFAVGGNIGIARGHTSNYSTSRSLLAFDGTSDLLKAMRGVSLAGGNVSHCSYTAESREAMIDKSAVVNATTTTTGGRGRPRTKV